jgi:hypothetical protein
LKLLRNSDIARARTNFKSALFLQYQMLSLQIFTLLAMDFSCNKLK